MTAVPPIPPDESPDENPRVGRSADEPQPTSQHPANHSAGYPADQSAADDELGITAMPGMAWSHELELDELVAALNDGQSPAWADVDPANATEDLAASGGRELTPGEIAGRVAERLPTGPGLAALLAGAPPTDLGDFDLPAVAAGFRRLASWATAAELAAVSQIAARAAARERTIGVGADGRPRQITRSATAQVALAETMTCMGAEMWTGLAVTLTWRLPATAAALSAGQIDLARAKLIAELTAALSDDKAREVEREILPAAGHRTMPQLRAAIRRAVIRADPDGADARRKRAERNATVALYPDDEGTVTLAGQSLPAIEGAAAMARIRAIVNAMKAAGADGGANLLSAQVFLGLLCGTLPYIPPAPAAPPDPPPPGSRPPGQPSPGSQDPSARDDSGALDDEPPDWPDGLPDDYPEPRDEDAPPENLPNEAAADPLADPDPAGDDCDEWPAHGNPTPPWPSLPDLTQPGCAPTKPYRGGRPRSGLLDLTINWSALATKGLNPAHLGTIGPITADQGRRIADVAATDPIARWRVIVTDGRGCAVATTHIPRNRGHPRYAAGTEGAGPGLGLVGRVTVVIRRADLAGPAPPPADNPSPIDRLIGAAWEAAVRAAHDAAQHADADMASPGRCAHQGQSPAYRPPPRLYQFIVARDQTCRFVTCGQPAWRGDLDHTVPYHLGGRTCRCNLGPACRAHHLIKQTDGWSLTQTQPGTFTWTTPAGRRYTTTPEPYLA